MLLKPLGELFSRHATVGEIKHEPLLFIERSDDLIAVQAQKDFHRGMGDTLVTVDKGVVQDERRAERRCFG